MDLHKPDGKKNSMLKLREGRYEEKEKEAVKTDLGVVNLSPLALLSP